MAGAKPQNVRSRSAQLAAPSTEPLAPEERVAEIGEILAAGLMRLEARKSSPISADCGDSSLHFSPDQSGAGSPNIDQQETA
jgi:hypothetical protein